MSVDRSGSLLSAMQICTSSRRRVVRSVGSAIWVILPRDQALMLLDRGVARRSTRPVTLLTDHVVRRNPALLWAVDLVAGGGSSVAGREEHLSLLCGQCPYVAV